MAKTKYRKKMVDTIETKLKISKLRNEVSALKASKAKFNSAEMYMAMLSVLMPLE